VVEALADLAEHVLGRHPDLLEGELRGVGGVHAHLLQLPRDLEPGYEVSVLVAQVHQEQGDALVARIGVCLRHQEDEVGPHPVGDEGLGA